MRDIGNNDWGLCLSDPEELRTAEPFESLFPIDPGTKAEIAESMKDRGYDPAHPVSVWRQRCVVVDGHTRRLAAIETGIREISVCFHDFADEEEALKYAIDCQRKRRNITNAEILRCIKAVDARKRRGAEPGGRGNQHTGGKASADALPDDTRKSAEVTARIVGVSPKTVERARSIIDHAKEDPSIEQAVLDGKESIRMAERRVADKKKKKAEAQRREYHMPSPARVEPRAHAPSRLRHTPEDEAWLAGFPLRARVVADRFDEDALLYRRFRGVLDGIKPGLLDVVGERSSVGMSLLYRALHQVCSVAPIELWLICARCNGTGIHSGRCDSCRGGGYSIPGLSKKD